MEVIVAEGNLGNGVTRHEFADHGRRLATLEGKVENMRVADATSQTKIALLAAGVGAIVSTILSVLGGLVLWALTRGG